MQGSTQSVTISIEEYISLLRDRAELLEIRGSVRPILCHGTKFKFRHDREVVEFLNQFSLSGDMDSIAAEALKRFGKDRAPSRSSVHRYAQRYRKHLGLTSAK